MDLFKAFDTVNQELLSTKRDTYDFNKDASKTIHNYLKTRYQRT